MGQNCKTPEPIDKKIGLGNYVGDNCQQAKTIAPLGAYA